MKSISTNAKVVEVRQLSKSLVTDLIHGRILAIRVFPFVKFNDCFQWQKDIDNSLMLQRYSNATDVPVQRIGMTLFETENKEEKINKYLLEASKMPQYLEQVFGSRDPLQSLFKGLKKIWPNGVVQSK